MARGGGGHSRRRILTSPAADADANAKTAIADKPELFLDLVRILRDVTSPAAIRCMPAVVQVRGRLARASMVRAGPSPHWRWAWIDQSIDEPSRAAADLVVLLGFHHVLLATCRSPLRPLLFLPPQHFFFLSVRFGFCIFITLGERHDLMTHFYQDIFSLP